MAQSFEFDVTLLGTILLCFYKNHYASIVYYFHEASSNALVLKIVLLLYICRLVNSESEVSIA